MLRIGFNDQVHVERGDMFAGCEGYCESNSLDVTIFNNDDYEEVCRHCGEVIEEDDGVWYHEDSGEMHCYEDTDRESAEPNGNVAPVNWVSCELDNDRGEARLSFSLGDPRGGVELRIMTRPNPRTGEDETIVVLPTVDHPHVNFVRATESVWVVGPNH